MSPDTVIILVIGVPIAIALGTMIYGWRDFYTLGKEIIRDFKR
jgi:phosphate/sulfate permease